MNTNHSLTSSLFGFIVAGGFIFFTIYIICINFWGSRLYKLIIKTDPDFFGNNSKLFLAKYFARFSMLSVIMSGQYTKITINGQFTIQNRVNELQKKPLTQKVKHVVIC